jgi:preprotein translocase subunit YajC
MAEIENGDAVVVTGSGYGVIVRQNDGTVRVRFLTGTEEDVDSRYVEPAAPSLAEQIKEQVRKTR